MQRPAEMIGEVTPFLSLYDQEQEAKLLTQTIPTRHSVRSTLTIWARSAEKLMLLATALAGFFRGANEGRDAIFLVRSSELK